MQKALGSARTRLEGMLRLPRLGQSGLPSVALFHKLHPRESIQARDLRGLAPISTSHFLLCAHNPTTLTLASGMSHKLICLLLYSLLRSYFISKRWGAGGFYSSTCTFSSLLSKFTSLKKRQDQHLKTSRAPRGVYSSLLSSPTILSIPSSHYTSFL